MMAVGVVDTTRRGGTGVGGLGRRRGPSHVGDEQDGRVSPPAGRQMIDEHRPGRVRRETPTAGGRHQFHHLAPGFGGDVAALPAWGAPRPAAAPHDPLPGEAATPPRRSAARAARAASRRGTVWIVNVAIRRQAAVFAATSRE